MQITARGLNRSTLARQMLLRRESLSVTDAIRRVVALQAQQPASPYLALWNRIDRFDPAELDGAFEEAAVVKSNQVRMTLHATHVDDYPAFREATEPPPAPPHRPAPRGLRRRLTGDHMATERRVLSIRPTVPCGSFLHRHRSEPGM